MPPASRGSAARFAEDNLSAPIETFGGGEAVPGGTVEVCQFGLYYSYMRLGRSCDCGMLYIIKLPDNSLFLVDGRRARAGHRGRLRGRDTAHAPNERHPARPADAHCGLVLHPCP